MPKTTKDVEKKELNNKKTTAKKTTSTKATTTKKKKIDEEKAIRKVTKSKTEKDTIEKDAKTTAKKSASTKTAETKKKTSTATTKKKSTATTKKKTNSSTTRKKTTTKKLEENIVAEYYDLPYRYNETVVKILYQTPTILFVYWDISDFDRENYTKQYGENFFNNTKPILRVYNLTKNYNFDVEINDFANSWYINVNDANCEYKVELARKTINFQENLNIDYIHITTSNELEFPNDHILLEKLPNKIKFKNVKSNETYLKDISTLHLVGINKIYNVKEFYKTFYKDEIIEENIIINPSSSLK